MEEHEVETPAFQVIGFLGGPTAAGRLLGMSHEGARKIRDGEIRVTPERAVQLEKLTDGHFTRDQFCPEIFEASLNRNSAEVA